MLAPVSNHNNIAGITQFAHIADMENQDKRNKKINRRDSELLRERPFLRAGDLYRSDEEMNEIRRRVLTFDPVILITQENQPKFQPRPVFLVNKKNHNNHHSTVERVGRYTGQDHTSSTCRTSATVSKEETLNGVCKRKIVTSLAIEVANSIMIEYENSISEKIQRLMTNTVSAGTPETEGYTEMANSYTEFIPKLKTTHPERPAPTLSQRLDDAVWIACNVVKCFRKGDLKVVKDIGLGAGDAVIGMGKNASKSLKRISGTGTSTGTMRSRNTIKGIGKVWRREVQED